MCPSPSGMAQILLLILACAAIHPMATAEPTVRALSNRELGDGAQAHSSKPKGVRTPLKDMERAALQMLPPAPATSEQEVVDAGMSLLNKVSKKFLEEGSHDMDSLAQALRDQGRDDEAASVEKLAHNLLSVEQGVERKFANHSTHRLKLLSIVNVSHMDEATGTKWTLDLKIAQSKCSLIGCGDSGTPRMVHMVLWDARVSSPRYKMLSYTISKVPGTKESSTFSSNERLIKQLDNHMDMQANDPSIDPQDPLKKNRELDHMMTQVIKSSHTASSKHHTPHSPASAPSPPAPDTVKADTSSSIALKSLTSDGGESYLWVKVFGLCLGVAVVFLAAVAAVYYYYRLDIRTHDAYSQGWSNEQERKPEEEGLLGGDPDEEEVGKDDVSTHLAPEPESSPGSVEKPGSEEEPEVAGPGGEAGEEGDGSMQVNVEPVPDGDDDILFSSEI